MGRPKKLQGDLLGEECVKSTQELHTPGGGPPGGGPPAAGIVGVPGVLEYTPLAATEKWRVALFEQLCAEFAFNDFARAESWMVQLHEIGMQYSRPFLLCRRLFGIGPVIPPANANPDDLVPASRAELCQIFGLQPAELQAELDMLRALAISQTQALDRQPPQAEEPRGGPPPGALGGLEFGEDILREFGFSEKMFEMVATDPVTGTKQPRATAENRIEKEWFCQRLREWRKMLAEPNAATLVRAALMNDLFLRRFDAELTGLSPASKKWEELYKSKRQMEQQFQGQLEQISKMFPEMAIADKLNFRATLSDLIKACCEYYGRGDHALIDKVNTAAEMEVLLRMSLQMPEPKYRFGLNLAIVEAQHGLYDPNFRPQFKHSVLRKIDLGFKEGVMRAREAQNEPLVDLEKGVLPGEGDDYPDLNEYEDKNQKT